MTGIKEWNMRLIRVEEESALLGFRRTAAAGTEETLLKSRNICLSALIEAEAQRVLYALTMPEYLEAWLVLPDVSRIECHSEQRSFDRFRIDLFYSDRPRESIHGSCYLSKPNMVTYLWGRERDGSGAKSLVEISLCRGDARRKLILRHIGLRDCEQRQWHKRMWAFSLEKLCRLLEGNAATAQHAGRTG